MIAVDVETWIFDVDNTLYPASAGLFDQIRDRVQTYIARSLNLSAAEAAARHRAYARTYGTSLRGLMTCHGVDPAAFLAEAHDVDYTVLKPDPVLANALARLPGRKFLFTSGTVAHARKVLARLGIDPALFTAVIDIVATGYVPKPAGPVYDALLTDHGVCPETAVMAEDSACNLVPALERGLYGLLIAETLPPALIPHGDRVRATPDLGVFLAAYLNRRQGEMLS